ncbi:hypothetical protein BDV93DRAFT_611663 [Ceratobasidium sp. AG-I]|nr:hypothetical protein BDV93DRAFT_611663 [Ceratobasidium sp. AG-I]
MSILNENTPEPSERTEPTEPTKPIEPAEPDDLGVNPEDLPLEDPPSETDGSEDGFDDNDGWWEGGEGGEEDIVDKENARRIDNQPIPANDQDEMISQLDKIIEDSFEGRGKEQRSKFD